MTFQKYAQDEWGIWNFHVHTLYIHILHKWPSGTLSNIVGSDMCYLFFGAFQLSYGTISHLDPVCNIILTRPDATSCYCDESGVDVTVVIRKYTRRELAITDLMCIAIDQCQIPHIYNPFTTDIS